MKNAEGVGWLAGDYGDGARSHVVSRQTCLLDIPYASITRRYALLLREGYIDWLRQRQH